MKNRRIAIIVVTLIFGLIVLDQACKLLVDNLFESPRDLMTETALLHLHPTVNDENYLGLLNISQKISMPIFLIKIIYVIITVTVVSILSYILHLFDKITFYDHRELHRPYTMLTVICFSLIVAGVACSLIDTTFWNGTLDFICHASRRIISDKRVIHHRIFDLKDLYLWSGAVLVVVRVYLWEKSVKPIDKDEIKGKLLHPIKHIRLIKGKK